MASVLFSLSNDEIESLALEEKDGGVIVEVKAHPAAKKDAIIGVHDGQLKVDTTSAPEKGKANDAIRKFLAKCFDVGRGDVELVSGHACQKKRFRIDGISKETCKKLLRGK